MAPSAALPAPDLRTEPDELLPADLFAADAPPLAALTPLIGFLLLLALSVLFADVRGSLPAVVAFTSYAVVLAACAYPSSLVVGLLLAACAWFDYVGFYAGSDGTLHWHGWSDAIRAVLLLAVVAAAEGVRRARRNSLVGAAGG